MPLIFRNGDGPCFNELGRCFVARHNERAVNFAFFFKKNNGANT